MNNEDAPRTIAMGDIHGCVHALEAIIGVVEPRAEDTIVCLGDFVDQGRETREVIDALLELKSTCRLITILGNHEEMLLASLDDERAKNQWLNCGGISTLNSYHFGGDIDVIPAEHLDFIRRARDYYETDDHIFVHANYEPDTPPAEWPEYVLRWSLLDDPHPPPHMSGKPVIVGHTEQQSGDPLDLGCVQCIDTACYSYGWLTALDVTSGTIWQASRWGAIRESPHEPKPLRLPRVGE